MRIQWAGVIAVLAFSGAVANEGYYQAPGIRGNTIVFTAEGDLWLYRLDGGDARRLTTHPSFESSAALSKDGSQVAFVADYEGVGEAYVMPVTGGIPRRLTYENAGVIVHGWSSADEVLYSTASRNGAPSNMALRSVSIASLEVTPVPLADAYDGIIDEAGNTVWFTQFGLQWSGDNANVYRGGLRGHLWKFHLTKDAEATRILPDHAGNVRRPMAGGARVYFISDASGRDNIWSVGMDGEDVQQLTRHENFSVRGASYDAGRIVYQLGADLYLLDTGNLESRKLDIELASDHPSLRESWVTEPLSYLTSARLAGDGSKLALTARGRIALAGVDETRLVNVATPQRSRMRNAALSRDGKWVYAMSDASGALELWRYDARGAAQSEQLTEGGDTLRGSFFESPDGKWVAHDDGAGGLWLLNTANKANRQIIGASRAFHQFDDLEWSPDSQRLAVSHQGRNDDRARILLHEIGSDRQVYLSADKYASSEPVFSHDGKWLYYLSDRHFATSSSVWEDRDFGPSFDKRTLVFAHALTDDARFPFQVPTELSAATEDTAGAENDGVSVQWDGLIDRVWQVPVAPGDYSDIGVTDASLFIGVTADLTTTLMALELEPHAELETVTEGIDYFELSDDRETMLVGKTSAEEVSHFIVPATAEFPEDLAQNTVRTEGWQFNIDPRAEWRQLFNDAWYMHREQFFDPAMRGVDWTAMREKYAPLVERVTDRRELNDILSQMMGELNALHSQVRGGDVPSDPDAPAPSVLGARLSQSGDGVVIDRIYQHESQLPETAPPLARNGVDAAAGDVIVSVNGRATPTLEAVHRALRNQAGQQVLLHLERGHKIIETVVVPDALYEDFEYSYRDWILSNRRKVEAVSADLGYLHIQAMGSRDVADFAREFYASSAKHGMIIDVRRNNGGNVDSWIIDRLMRKAWMFWSYADSKPGFNLQNTFRGHLVVIADEGTYSDGETFTAAIKALGIAPVIGKRTAGAGVWLSGRNRLSDAGIARVAEFPVFNMDGQWIVEGHGVSPTIEVENLPHATFNGADDQLDAAIEYLQRKLAEDPIPDVKARPFPPNGVPANDVP